MKKIFLLFLLTTVLSPLFSQFVTNDTIPIRGIVFDENRKVLPNTHILINNVRGTMTTPGGFFNINASARDTLTFSYVGYKTFDYVVPDTMSRLGFLTGVFLKRDTLYLNEIVVLPWLNKEEFRQAMINKKNLSKNESHAKANLSLIHASPGDKYSYLQKSGADVQMDQFNMEQQYKGLISPDDMVGVDIGAAVGLIINAFTWKKAQEKSEEVLKDRILEYKYQLDRKEKEDQPRK
jgi:hypothetical protein